MKASYPVKQPSFLLWKTKKPHTDTQLLLKSQKDNTRGTTHFCELEYEYFPRFLKHLLLFAVHLALPISGL